MFLHWLLDIVHVQCLVTCCYGANVVQEEGAGWGGVWAKGCLFISILLMIYFFAVVLELLHG